MALHGSVHDILRLQIVQMNFYINMHYAEPEDNKFNNIGSDLLKFTPKMTKNYFPSKTRPNEAHCANFKTLKITMFTLTY